MKNDMDDKGVFRILTCSGETAIVDSVKIMAQWQLGSGYVVEVTDSANATEILELVRQRPFDLIVPLVNNIHHLPTGADGKSPAHKALELLARLKAQYGIPVVVLCTGSLQELPDWADLPDKATQLGMDAFLWTPVSVSEFRVALPTCLKATNPIEAVGGPRTARPLRIVMLDDEPTVLDNLKTVLEFELDDAKILAFTDDEEALQELTREDPDLFTTDWYHPKIPCGEMLRLLAARQAKYPIFVISGYAESDMAKGLVRQFVAQGLNVTLLAKPWTVEQLRALLLKHIGPGENPQPQSLKELR